MKLHELNIKFKKKKKRVGRGPGSGKGKTAGRGTKGQKARSGGRLRPGFEGGQTPLIQRIPKKRGFRSLRPRVEIVNLRDLEKVKSDVIDKEKLAAAGLINDPKSKVKILGIGEVKKKFIINVDLISKKATEKIIKAGGSIKE